MPSAADLSLIADAKERARLYSRYLTTHSATDADACAQACSELIILLPQEVERSGAERVRFDLARYEKLLQMAKDAAIKFRKASTGSTRYLSSGCRL